MRKAMSKKVGAGGRFDIFLDSDVKEPIKLAYTNCALSAQLPFRM